MKRFIVLALGGLSLLAPATGHGQTIQVNQLPVAPSPLASSTPFWCAYKIANVYTTAQCQMGQIASYLTGGANSWTGANSFSNINITGGTIGAGVSVSVANATGVLAATNGGTAQSTYAKGDTLYASAANTLSRLAIGSTGDVYTVSAGVPVWSPLSSSVVTSFSGGSTGLTPATGTTGAVTIGGTLAVANGGTGVTSSTGTGATVRNVSPSLTTPTITGITSGSAPASGQVGQIVCAQVWTSGSPSGCSVNSTTGISLTSGTATNITSISLGAGFWSITATAVCATSGTTIAAQEASITPSSATQLPIGAPGSFFSAGTSLSGSQVSLGVVYVNSAGSSTYYLVESCNYTGGSVSGFGSIFAVRIG